MMQASIRRNTELSLLVLALIVGLGGLALAAVGRTAAGLGNAGPLMVILAAAYVGAHLAVRKLAPQGDHLLLPLVAALNIIGLAAVFRLSPRGFGPAQMTWTIVSLALFVATLAVVKDHRALARYKYLAGLLGVALLLLPLTPLGVPVRGARLWLDLGPLRFQPGELAKLALVIFFAAYLAERKELLAVASGRFAGLKIPDLKHFGPLLLMWVLSLAIMFFETDLGSSLLFFSIFLVMLYMATARAIYVALGSVLFAAGAWVGYQAFSHVRTRVRVWLDVFDPQLINDEGYQMAQSLFALATGGLFGTGLGQGRPDLIPAAHTDFIYSVLGEELGLMGSAAVLVMFLLLVGRGLFLSLRATDDFGKLLAAGLTTIFAIQTIIILGGVTRLLPLTGITLPFMSYGGSSLVSNFILVALLIRVSDRTSAMPEPAATGEIIIGPRS